MTAIPHGPDNMYCPFWRQKMAKVCHTCPFWQMLRGVHPQTGEPIPDEWNCSLGHLTKLLLENAQQSRQAGASADKVANEIDKFHKSMTRYNEINLAINRTAPTLITRDCVTHDDDGETHGN